MLDKAGSEFPCARDDASCLCQYVNFGYGVRDCSIAVCSESDADTTINWAKKWCADAGIDLNLYPAAAVSLRISCLRRSPSLTTT